MAELKTQENDRSVKSFLDAVEPDQRRQDCYTILAIMEKATGSAPKMWGDSIVGFGRYHYKYASGREGDWMLSAFSPRKQNLTLYIMAGFDRYEELLSKLGKFKTGKACLYVKTLADVDLTVLEELIQSSVDHIKATYPPE
ncbi:MAG: hypothetical protein BGO78_05010 [Chloroflexi bacterium 44-23]|nr:MAG: hypothetical protein BGO78_05010 [Chloroflexi bacterium 44-23]